MSAGDRPARNRTAQLVRAGFVALVALALLTAAGSAAAYFAALGAGSGAASTTASTAAVTLTAGTASNDLYPGGSGTVSTTVTNSGNADVLLPSLVLDTAQGTGGFAVDAAHSACTLGSFSFATQTGGGTGWTVAANASRTITLPASVTMAQSAPNGCQGAILSVYLKVGS